MQAIICDLCSRLLTTREQRISGFEGGVLM